MSGGGRGAYPGWNCGVAGGSYGRGASGSPDCVDHGCPEAGSSGEGGRVDDVGADGRLDPALLGAPDAATALLVPLSYRRRTVGVLVVDERTRTAPAGLRDSKLLTPAAREVLVPQLRRWAVAWAVGHAEPAEIDAVGITAALRLAGRRAL